MAKLHTRVITLATIGVLLCVSAAQGQWTTQWQLGAPRRGWPVDGVGGGPDVDFLQENGTGNPLPGSPTNPAVHQQSDDDYYFAGSYPAFNVPTDEIGFERGFVPNDSELRVHFNLPSSLHADDRFRFSFEANTFWPPDAPDSRYGVEVSFNGTLVFPEVVIRPGELNTVFTTMEFTAADVGAIGGSGADNILAIGGISYHTDGGGLFVGMDYHHLEVMPIPEPATMSLLAITPMLLLRHKRRYRPSSGLRTRANRPANSLRLRDCP